jgi:hypothetical protein
MMVTLYHKKFYRGGFESPETAAEYYDQLSILIFGLEVSSIL